MNFFAGGAGVGNTIQSMTRKIWALIGHDLGHMFYSEGKAKSEGR